MKTTLQRIKEYLDYKGINVTTFEKSIGASNGSFASQLKNNKTIGVDKLENILHIYEELSPDWLLTGKGAMSRKPVHFNNNFIDEQENPNNLIKGIPLLPEEAFAGKGMSNFKDLVIERFYDIHEFKDADFLIPVKGNSMYPKYSSGDILACKLVKEKLFFQWNKAHVIYTNSQGVMVKRMKKSKIEGCVLCVSDNHNYDPFDVPLSDIIDLALVIGVIRLE